MSSVAGVNCTMVHDRDGTIPSVVRELSESWHVPGLDGIGLQLVGRGDAEFSVEAVLYSNDAGVDLWAASLYALQGTIGSIVDDHGDTYTYCFIRSVANVVKTVAMMSGGITTRGAVQISGSKVA